MNIPTIKPETIASQGKDYKYAGTPSDSEDSKNDISEPRIQIKKNFKVPSLKVDNFMLLF